MFSLIASFLLLQAAAQTTPNGFKKGNIVLADGTVQTGLIKENLGDASVQFINEGSQGKKKYASTAINSFQADGVQYSVIKNDFFKVITDGGLCFLQKASNVSGKLAYFGTEAVVLTGTAGETGDYFFYNKTTSDLQQVNAANVNQVTQTVFAGHPDALQKAQSVQNDIPKLSAAVDSFNAGR